MNTEDFKIVYEALEVALDQGTFGIHYTETVYTALERLRKELEGKDDHEPTEADLRASYLEGQAKCGLKVGDRVRMVRVPKDFEDGWNNGWTVGVLDCVLTIEGLCGIDGVALSDPDEPDATMYLPYFVLEKVEKKRVPLEMKDWAGGPWWVREDQFDRVDLVIQIEPTRIATCIEWFDLRASCLERLERSTDLENWSGCYNEVEE